MTTLEILYQDEHIVAVHKPAGLLVHRTKEDAYETEFALQILSAQLSQIINPVHRLDKPTSGVLLFARSKKATQAMQALFAQGLIYKHYQALVRGFILQPQTINYPVGMDSQSPKKEALTDIIPEQYFEINTCVDSYPTSRYTLINAIPKTGRQHQIRKHLRHIKHPIVGDVNYGSSAHNRFFRTHFNLHRLFLACTQICFEHPFLGQEIKIKAELAQELKQVLASLPKKTSRKETI